MWYLKYLCCKKSILSLDGETFVCDEVYDASLLENETYNYIHTHIYTKTNWFQNKFINTHSSKTTFAAT